jgi:hypothetical protein
MHVLIDMTPNMAQNPAVWTSMILSWFTKLT